MAVIRVYEKQASCDRSRLFFITCDGEIADSFLRYTFLEGKTITHSIPDILGFGATERTLVHMGYENTLSFSLYPNQNLNIAIREFAHKNGTMSGSSLEWIVNTLEEITKRDISEENANT